MTRPPIPGRRVHARSGGTLAARAFGIVAPLAAILLAACSHPGTAAEAGSLGPKAPPGGVAVQPWVTTGDESRLLHREPLVYLMTDSVTAPVIDVDASVRYQRMLGFGAAVTDASAYLIEEKMSPEQRASLLQDLFGRTGGIGLSFVRVPMGASDFSLRQYSYDDLPAGRTDSMLAHFSIDADRADKLPVLERALAIDPRITIMATPWSPPGWMKTTGSLIRGTLLPRYYDSFAQYFVKFIRAYAAEGVPVIAVSVQNEPNFEPADYPGMRLDAPQRARVIGDHVGPAFAAAGLRTQIWDWDHNWDLPQSPETVLADPAAHRYVQGVAWHCYNGDVTAQSLVHDRYPDKDTYFTECSGGGWAGNFADNLVFDVGTLVIGATRNWARTVALWNLALDEHDGPHTGGCGNCRGVVTITSTTGMYHRNVEYFALAHASRFVRPGAERIASTTGVDGLSSVAFRNADDGSTVLVVLNGSSVARRFAVRSAGRSFPYSLPPKSVVTFTWK